MKKIGILGSTGSIGVNALDVINNFNDKFELEFISAHSNTRRLYNLIKKFKPKKACITNISKINKFRKNYNIGKIKLYEGEDGLIEMIKSSSIDILIAGIVGSPALLPILTAINRNRVKRIALANKEAIVMAGDIIMKNAKKNNVEILPVDSEHSAIFQCLTSSKNNEIKKIYLTSSGGPLKNFSKKVLYNITPEEAANHPKWKMGKKISIDSATMMNKGLEVIEAHHLFRTPMSKIGILVHPEAVIHSMVEFIDGAVLSQMGDCDMRIPIQYALSYPDRFNAKVKKLDFANINKLHFYKPEFEKFPCLKLAYEAGMKGGTVPCVLNTANEVAVEKFIDRKIGFMDIPNVIKKVLRLHKSIKNPDIKDILKEHAWAKATTKEIIYKL